MPDDTNPTSPPPTPPGDERYRQVIEQLRVDRGAPPAVPISHPRSESESAERIRQLSEPTPGFKGLIRPATPRPSIKRSPNGPHEALPDDPITLAAIKGINDRIGQHPPLSEDEREAGGTAGGPPST